LARDHRRLAAIVSLDVVGYSRLMGVDDSGTLAALKAHRRGLIDPKIAEHDGRIVKTTGDGLLLEFSSVVDAVRCAVDVQRGMAERNKGIGYRLGCHLRLLLLRQVAKRHDAHEVLVPIEHRQPAYLDVGHVARHLLELLVIEAIEHFLAHDLAHRRVGGLARRAVYYRVFPTVPRVGRSAICNGGGNTNRMFDAMA
jgi:hypothetical protein